MWYRAHLPITHMAKPAQGWLLMKVCCWQGRVSSLMGWCRL
jgi:hypothetical protein